MKRHTLWIALLIAAFTLWGRTTLFAQEVVTIAVPPWMTEALSEERFAAFEQEYGVDVVAVTPGFENMAFMNYENNVETYLEQLQSYVGLADVLTVNIGVQLSLASTRAGYFLDLTPLVSSDTALNTDDFVPAIWRAVQWEGGIWAVPATADINMVVYDRAAFDAAGLPYPDENWTLTDYAEAARQLVQRDGDGTITRGALVSVSPINLGYNELGQPLYDPFTLPYTPDFSSPALETMLQTWSDMQQEGLISDGQDSDEAQRIPIQFGSPYFLDFANTDGADFVAAPMPGGHSELFVQGFAISAGTQNPELAYALIRYLSLTPEVAQGFFGTVSARQSFVGNEDAQAEFMPELDPETQALVDQALAGALTYPDMLFSTYLVRALADMDEGADARTALNTAEASAQEDLQAVEDADSGSPVIVATPVPTAVLSQGEVALRFGYQALGSDLPNQELWEALAAEFAASDPQVGEVRLENVGFGGASDMIEDYDCTYSAQNLVYQIDTALLVSLDPYFSADPTYDSNDFITGALAQVQRDGQTWAYPLTIQPEVMRYSEQAFADAGLSAPQAGWTTDQFSDALAQLSNGEDPVFASRTPGSGYILMLIAAYGGLPVDYRVSPPTFDLTSPENVEAIRQVLDLAREGLLDYEALSSQNFNFGSGTGDQPPLYNETLGQFSFEVFGGEEADPDAPRYGTTTYPVGTRYVPINYGLGTAYISASTTNPDACYRWISTVAAHPELFDGMPARRSQLNDPLLIEAQGTEASAAYAAFFELAELPNAVTFPSLLSADASTLISIIAQEWMYRAFNAYVLEDADLQTELDTAQGFIDAYDACVAPFLPLDLSVPEEQLTEQVLEVLRCTIAVDPEMEELYGPIIEMQEGQ